MTVLGRLGQRELHHVDVFFIKCCFAISQVKLPQTHKGGIKAELLYGSQLRHEGLAPAAQCFSVIGTKWQLINNRQTRQLGLLAKLGRAGQTAAGKNVLLNEVG